MKFERSTSNNEGSTLHPASHTNTNGLSIQRKLSIGAVNDPLEYEADAVADKVMRMPEQNFVQRKCAHFEEEERAQRKPSESFLQKKSSEANSVSDSVANKIQSTKGGGNVLPEVTKSFMESRFGADFSNVKIHTGSYASQLSKDLNAQAFTVGNDVYFNEGKYSPESDTGKHLLAHELTHTIQQEKNNFIRRVTSHYGEFKDESYTTLTDAAGNSTGVEMYMKFKPNNNVDSTLIGMVQSVRSVQNGVVTALNPTVQSRMIPAADAITTSSPVLATDEGTHIDQLAQYRNPLYATGAVKNSDKKLSQAKTPEPVKKLPAAHPGPQGQLYSGWGKHGYHYKKGRSIKSKDAELHDTPILSPIGNNFEQLFETSALSIKGKQEGTYYGSVEWGWRTDSSGTFSQVPLTLKSAGTPSSSFLKSAEIWNTGKSSANKKNLKLPVQDVYIISNFLGTTLNKGISGPLISEYLLVGTRVNILEYHTMGPFMPGDEYAGKVLIEIVDSAIPDQLGLQGWVDFSDLTDERP